MSPVPESARRWTDALCHKCGGNGVIRIHHGVSICPRCSGRCYEPGADLQATQCHSHHPTYQQRCELERNHTGQHDSGEFAWDETCTSEAVQASRPDQEPPT